MSADTDPAARLTPPHSAEAERALLGGILLDGAAALERAQAAGLAPEDFYLPEHAAIYATMLGLSARAAPIDLITVTDRLTAKGRLAQAGGAAYVMSLAAEIPTSAHVRAYADSVRETAIVRRVLSALRVAAQDCESRRPLGEVQARVLEAFDAATGSVGAEARHVSEYREAAQALLEGKGGSGIPTGWPAVDERLTGGGLTGGRLYLIAARPGMGKSAMAIELVRRAASLGVGVLAFSLEMSGEENLQRLWAQQAKRSIRRPRGEDWSAFAGAQGEVDDMPIWFADQAGASIADVRRIARRYRRSHGIGLVVVDYLQLMEVEGENQNLAIGAVSKGLKNLARELDVPVVALSQLNREVEKRPTRRPTQSDLRDSGSLEQDADVIIFLWRPEAYRGSGALFDRADFVARVEVNIDKQRNGPTGAVWLRWDGPTFSIGSLPHEEWPRA